MTPRQHGLLFSAIEQRRWCKPSDAAKYDDAITNLVDSLLAEARAEAPIWDDRRELQIDSYATGHKMVHARIFGNDISIEVTDGSSSWRAQIPAPWAAAIRARKDDHG